MVVKANMKEVEKRLDNRNAAFKYNNGGGGYSSKGGGSGSFGAPNVSSYSVKDYSLNDLINSATSGVGGAYRPDISGLIDAYTTQANADKRNVENNYNNTRSDLLDSLKRFQENNSKQQATQRQSYLTDRSFLDVQKELANRQSRIGNAARGLGGSGLLKLSEIQNELGMQGDESLLMNRNQSILDALRTALAQENEDTNKRLDRAKNLYDNQIKDIDANLASQIAAANYQADQQYAQSLANANASRAQGQAAARNAYNILTGNTQALNDNLSRQSVNDLIKTYGATSTKDLADTIANYYSDLFANTRGINNNAYNRAMENVYGLLGAKGLLSKAGSR